VHDGVGKTDRGYVRKYKNNADIKWEKALEKMGKCKNVLIRKFDIFVE